jgi:D-galacturonate reductase
MGSKGEIRVNQAKRGYEYTNDADGQVQWINPYVLPSYFHAIIHMVGQAVFNHASCDRYHF